MLDIKSMVMIIKINLIWINDLFMIMVITIIIIINMMITIMIIIIVTIIIIIIINMMIMIITIMISRGRVMMGMRGMSRGPGRPPLSNMGAMPRSILMMIIEMKTMMLMMTVMMMMMMTVVIIMMMVIRMMGRGSRGGLLPSVRGRPSLVSNGMGRGIMPG